MLTGTPQAGVTAAGGTVTPTSLVGVTGTTALPVTGSVTAAQPAALPFTGSGGLPEELALGGVLIALGAAVRRIGRPRTALR